MEQIIFDSRSLEDKVPFGALKSASNVKIGLLALKSLKFLSISLLLHNDIEKIDLKYPLIKLWEDDVYARYELSFISPEAGLYWYHFIAETSEGLFHVSNIGGKASLQKELSGSWQLTIYDKSYETPSWLKGGLIYQIFVDI